MPSNDPPPPDDPTPREDELRRLEQRLDRASAAAERLIAEAAARAGGPSEEEAEAPADDDPTGGANGPPKPPPAGWQLREESARGSDRELELLSDLLRSVRELVPPELQRRLAAALRELLLAVRALIDFYLDRLERRTDGPVEVEDIPIS